MNKVLTLGSTVTLNAEFTAFCSPKALPTLLDNLEAAKLANSGLAAEASPNKVENCDFKLSNPNFPRLPLELFNPDSRNAAPTPNCGLSYVKVSVVVNAAGRYIFIASFQRMVVDLVLKPLFTIVFIF